MTRSVLLLSVAALSLSACVTAGKYPVSGCEKTSHYPVACQEIQEGVDPGDLKTVDVPNFKGV